MHRLLNIPITFWYLLTTIILIGFPALILANSILPGPTPVQMYQEPNQQTTEAAQNNQSINPSNQEDIIVSPRLRGIVQAQLMRESQAENTAPNPTTASNSANDPAINSMGVSAANSAAPVIVSTPSPLATEMMGSNLAQAQNPQGSTGEGGAGNSTRPAANALNSGAYTVPPPQTQPTPSVRPIEGSSVPQSENISNSSDTGQQASIKIDALSAELDQLNQQLLLFQQQNSRRFEALEYKNKIIENEIKQISVGLNVQSQKMEELNKNMDAIMADQQSMMDVHSKPITKHLGFIEWLSLNLYSLIVGGILIILLIIFLIMLFYGGKSETINAQNAPLSPEKKNQKNKPTLKEKYNVINAESGGDKLDLARAYVAMEDEEAAVKILNEIIIEGNLEQQQEAQELLKSLTTSYKS